IKRVRVILERIEAFTKLVETALGPEGKLAMIILTFMVPEEIDACYEVKNTESNHGLYRFNGTGNRVSAGLLDLLGLVSEAIEAMKGVVKALKTVLGLPKGAEKAIQFIEKFIKDLHADTVEVARSFGPGMADVVDVMLTMMENGVTTKAMFAPASGFVKFKFHDGSAKHGVAELEGPARQTVFGLVFNQVVDIEFGGFVPNNFRDFQAEAKIQRSIVDLFEVQAVGLGRFILLKGNYGNDVVVGPTDIVKD
ncbi:MAG TPA: hypothetical protein VFT24_11910, partial [Vicinamibacterales bacterium]|nr:hypothetical protein [Vicinamibacterales bacterium]